MWLFIYLSNLSYWLGRNPVVISIITCQTRVG